ncbi:tRNA pseudouridine(55) synthase TruB [bacterium DOLZORAL124_38_8]|nr:MAG: tRNA pseudouridine(55) synthase TruB [bacterium DOLZORAL124_38_8]
MPKFTNKSSGFLLIDKPVGWTSFDVCGRLRKTLAIKRVGHTGTLDPFATGLLVVAFGKATKMIPFLDKASKTYVAKILLGKTSETLDTESEIETLTTDFDISVEQVSDIMTNHFSGKIQQIPPKYSALKVGGKKMCDLVRAGKEVEVKPRATEILNWKVLSVNNDEKSVELELEVAAGFYVRSFARDLGLKIAGGGLCSQLRRTRVGNLLVSQALEVESVDKNQTLVDPVDILTNFFKYVINKSRVNDFMAGRAFPIVETVENGTKVLVICDNKTVGMAEIVDDKLQPRIVF